MLRISDFNSCLPFVYILYMLYVLAACGCNPLGSARDDCEQMTGRCMCLPGVTGQKCGFCINGNQLVAPGSCDGICSSFAINLFRAGCRWTGIIAKLRWRVLGYVCISGLRTACTEILATLVISRHALCNLERYFVRV